jgi:hypothetical protein
MRLDHVSYVASHDQISDVVNRIGSQIGTAFVDGGIHPKFGTRNFTAPLLDGQYIEVVCPMDHPATETTPFGRAVKNKADAGGGWMSWVIATNDINKIEIMLERKAVDGQRKRPNGTILNWKQIGVLATIENSQTPFFVEWFSNEHPSLDGDAVAKITKIYLSGEAIKSKLWLDASDGVKKQGIEIELLDSYNIQFEQGITQIDFEVNSKVVTII